MTSKLQKRTERDWRTLTYSAEFEKWLVRPVKLVQTFVSFVSRALDSGEERTQYRYLYITPIGSLRESPMIKMLRDRMAARLWKARQLGLINKDRVRAFAKDAIHMSEWGDIKQVRQADEAAMRDLRNALEPITTE